MEDTSDYSHIEENFPKTKLPSVWKTVVILSAWDKGAYGSVWIIKLQGNQEK